MRTKKVRSAMLEEAKKYLEMQDELPDFEELVVKICQRDLTLGEKVEAASKPLYLMRYE